MADDELKEALKEHYSCDIVDILSESLDHTIEERNELIGMCNRLKAENDKLRELVRQMAYAISPTSREHMLANLAEQGIEVDG